ncbi:MAG TPA: HAD-IIIA family hydrolase [Candidatus Binataceae bacterium]|nr:HAD-IIIA family hydrolase [Candidatus Binataceae bacterium]
MAQASDNAGNVGLFCDLAGTLVAMDETRQLPLDRRGEIEVRLMPGVREKLAPMRNRLIFVVSNQAGIKRGRLTLAKVEAALARLDAELGGILTAWEICPHDDADACACRKPKGGMITELAWVHGVDLAASTMVGDQQIDADAAHAAGVGQFVWAREFFDWS